MQNQDKEQNQEQKHNSKITPQSPSEIESLNDNEELEPDDLEDVAGGGCFIRGCNKTKTQAIEASE